MRWWLRSYGSAVARQHIIEDRGSDSSPRPAVKNSRGVERRSLVYQYIMITILLYIPPATPATHSTHTQHAFCFSGETKNGIRPLYMEECMSNVCRMRTS